MAPRVSPTAVLLGVPSQRVLARALPVCHGRVDSGKPPASVSATLLSGYIALGDDSCAPGPRPRRGSLRAPASELVAEPNSGQVLVTHHTWPVTDSSRMSGLCCFRSQVQQHPQRRTSFSSPRVGSPGLFVTGMVYACCVLGFTVGRWISPQRSPWCGRTRGRLHPAAPPGFRHTRRPAAHEDKPHLFRDVRRKTAFRNLRAPVSNAATREQDAEYWGLLQFT